LAHVIPHHTFTRYNSAMAKYAVCLVMLLKLWQCEATVCDGCEDGQSLLSVYHVQDKRSVKDSEGVEVSVGVRHTWQAAFDEDPSMFEGCSKVFIDVGSNAGTHIRKLFEPEKYPNCSYLKLFDSAIGDASFRGQASAKSGICSFGFEANPRWEHRYREIEAAYSRQGWRARWFAPFFVSNETGSETFYLNDKGKHADWGASNVNHRGKHTPKVKVQNLQLADFLEALNTHVAAGGHKLMKMDIEGAEFTVLPDLIKNNLLCEGSVDTMTIEWHDGVPKDKQAAKNLKKEVLGLGKCGQKKDTEVLTLDDESYLEDGKPLP